MQTAKLAFPSKQVQVADSLSFLRYNYGSAEMRGKYGAELKALLSSPVANGVNRAAVSHGNVLKHIGIDDTGLQELGFIVLDGDLNAIAITEPMAFSNLIYEIALSAP